MTSAEIHVFTQHAKQEMIFLSHVKQDLRGLDTPFPPLFTGRQLMFCDFLFPFLDINPSRQKNFDEVTSPESVSMIHNANTNNVDLIQLVHLISYLSRVVRKVLFRLSVKSIFQCECWFLSKATCPVLWLKFSLGLELM